MKEPYISATKLAEYMQAKPIRRRQILQSLKEDSDFKKLRYAEAKNQFNHYCASGYSPMRIDAAIARLQKKKGTTTWDENNDPNTILALENLKACNMPNLSNYSIFIPADKVETMDIKGLLITLKPEVYLSNNKTGNVGAIKFHIAKTAANQLDEQGRECAATLIRHGLIVNGYNEKDVETKACIAVDVFRKDHNHSATAYKRMLGNIEATCEEIVARWPTI